MPGISIRLILDAFARESYMRRFYLSSQKTPENTQGSGYSTSKFCSIAPNVTVA